MQFANAQTDPLSNFYSLSDHYENYYDSIEQIHGSDTLISFGYKSYLKWKSFMMERHGDNGELNGAWNIVNNYHENTEGLSNIAYEANWLFLGPVGIPPNLGNGSTSGNGEGMITTLWVDSSDFNTVFAGTHNSGLWKTNDGGNAWINITDSDERIYGVKDIVVHPENQNIIYITSVLSGVSNYPAGVFKTVNGGVTWEKMGISDYDDVTYFHGAAIRKLIMHPDSSHILYFINAHNVWKTIDNGVSWNNIYNNEYPWGNPTFGFFDIEVDPNNPERLYLAANDIHIVKDDGLDFELTNITDSVLNAGNYGILTDNGKRIEVSTHINHPGKVWFSFYAGYEIADTTTQNDTVWFHRIVKYDTTVSPNYQLLMNKEISAHSSGYGSGWMMEFEVSPANEHLFYLGTVALYNYCDTIQDSLQPYGLHGSGGPTTENWMHIDIRDIKVLSNDQGKDVIYSANDGGISWGIFEGGYAPPYEHHWHWRYFSDDGTDGIIATEFYGIGIDRSRPYRFAGGVQDCNSFGFNENGWYHFGSGDGLDCVYSTDKPDTLYWAVGGNSNIYFKRSTDMGVNQATDGDFNVQMTGGILTGGTVALNPSNSSQIFIGTGDLYRFDSINDFSQPPVRNKLNLTISHPITNVEFVKNGTSKRLYVSTAKSISNYSNWEEPQNLDSCILTSTSGMSWEDISSNLLGCYNGIITDVEVDPENLQHIWVSCGVARDNFENSTHSFDVKKVYTTFNMGYTWLEYANGIPNALPVHVIKYSSKYKRLFAGTDAGVFTRSILDTCWYPFNDNLSEKIITDIEVNDNYDKVVISTYGRGIWESTMNCFYDPESQYIVDGTEIWDEDVFMTTDILIPGGSELAINNCNVFMPADSRIIIQKDGSLKLNGAHISNACEHLWLGIEVWGDPNEEHDTTHQGFVASTGESIIENAQCAIYTTRKTSEGEPIQGWGGGILQISNTTFRNNRTAVELWPYSSSSETYFHSCIFETTEDLYDEFDFKAFIVMQNYDSVGIKGCTFQNTRPAEDLYPHTRGIGIKSLESMFILTKDSTSFYEHYNHFNNLSYGIKAFNNTVSHGILAEDCNFNANLTGVYLCGGIDGYRITENNFNVNSHTSTYNNYDYIYCGLYLDNSTGYWVEGNYFSNDSTSQSSRPKNVIGITVNNSGGEDNEIYRNTFDGMDIGILAQNRNRNDEDKGLLLKCNDFGPAIDNLEYDIAVTAYQGCINPGIRENQGSEVSQSSPAGNMFSHLPGSTFSDYYNEEGGIFYYQHIPIPSRLNLLDYTTFTIGKMPTGQPYVSGVSCKSMLTKSKGELKSDIDENDSKADSVSFLLNALVDGGNTLELEGEVATSTPPEAYSIYSDLIMKSPYLTDTVMIEAVNKEDVLNPVMIKEVLVANPQSAKSDEVMDELDTRMNPLPEYMIAEIEAGADSLGDKELMEASKSHFNHQRSINLNMLKLFYTFDTLGIGNADSLLVLLQNKNSIAAKYELAFEHIKRGEFSLAAAVINNIPNMFVLNDDQNNTHQLYLALWPVIIDMHQNNKSLFDLDSLQLDLIDSIAMDSTCMPGILARNMLVFDGILYYTEPYLLPDSSLKAISNTDNPVSQLALPPRFKVYPNPAGDYITIEYYLMQEGCNGYIVLNDNLGKTVNIIPVSAEMNSVVVSTSELSNGIYYVGLQCNNYQIETEKVIIKH